MITGRDGDSWGESGMGIGVAGTKGCESRVGGVRALGMDVRRSSIGSSFESLRMSRLVPKKGRATSAEICHADGYRYHNGLQITGWWFPPTRPGRFYKYFLRDSLRLPAAPPRFPALFRVVSGDGALGMDVRRSGMGSPFESLRMSRLVPKKGRATSAEICHADGYRYHNGLQITGWWFPPTRPGRFYKYFLRDSLRLPAAPPRFPALFRVVSGDGALGMDVRRSGMGSSFESLRMSGLVPKKGWATLDEICHADGYRYLKGLQITGWWFPPARPVRSLKSFSEGLPQTPGSTTQVPCTFPCG